MVKTRQTPPEDVNANPTQESTRDAFIHVHNTAQCRDCQAIGNFILNVTSVVARQMVQCKACNSRFSGPQLSLSGFSSENGNYEEGSSDAPIFESRAKTFSEEVHYAYP